MSSRRTHLYISGASHLLPAILMLLAMGMIDRALICSVAGIAVPIVGGHPFPGQLTRLASRPRLAFLWVVGIPSGFAGTLLVATSGRLRWPGGLTGFLLGYAFLSAVIGLFLVTSCAVRWLITANTSGDRTNGGPTGAPAQGEQIDASIRGPEGFTRHVLAYCDGKDCIVWLREELVEDTKRSCSGLHYSFKSGSSRASCLVGLIADVGKQAAIPWQDRVGRLVADMKRGQCEYIGRGAYEATFGLGTRVVGLRSRSIPTGTAVIEGKEPIRRACLVQIENVQPADELRAELHTMCEQFVLDNQ